VSPDELVARAAAMRDTLRARQGECEALGHLPDATNQEYVDAGFFRVLQPWRFGGYELGLVPEHHAVQSPNPGRPVIERDLGRATALTDTAEVALIERTWENVGQMRLGLAPGSFF
jgi:3-hydroxy-9,10-secoandrosta-1,3,5(10)-triene-9,17-dione monooxygenase